LTEFFSIITIKINVARTMPRNGSNSHHSRKNAIFSRINAGSLIDWNAIPIIPITHKVKNPNVFPIVINNLTI
jgi:LEA14-like dessication related protein